MNDFHPLRCARRTEPEVDHAVSGPHSQKGLGRTAIELNRRHVFELVLNHGANVRRGIIQLRRMAQCLSVVYGLHREIQLGVVAHQSGTVCTIVEGSDAQSASDNAFGSCPKRRRSAISERVQPIAAAPRPTMSGGSESYRRPAIR